MWTVDAKLLPIKAHYFFFMAAAGAILPFLPVLARALGVSAAALGFITSLLPAAVLVAKPSFGALSDRFPKYRHSIFMTAVIGQAISLAGLGIIPPLHAARHWSNTTTSHNSTTPEVTPESSVYMSATFWGFVTLMCLGNVCFNVANSLSDAICFEMLGGGKELDYGKQRVWGCVGWGGAALLSGASMAWWEVHDDVDTVGPSGLAPACLLTIVFGALDALSCCWLQLPERKASGSMLQDLVKLIKQKSASLFLVFAALVGVLDGFLIYYLLWYLEDLAGVDPGSLKLIEGLVVAAQTLGGEVLFFPLSGWILGKLGHTHCLTLCFSAYAVRLALLSAAPGPWWLLPVELFMQGPTYALGYATIVAYASAVAPSGTAATVQGIAAGVDDSLGYSIGSLVGGLLYRGLGGRGAFQSMGLLALACCISHLSIHEVCLNRRSKTNVPGLTPETVHLKHKKDKNYTNPSESMQLKSNSSDNINV